MRPVKYLRYATDMNDLLSAQFLYDEAESMGLHPEWLTEYGLFSFEVPGRTEYVFYGRTSLNSQVASYLATNKHTTRMILQKHGLPNIPFLLPSSFTEAQEFLSVHEKIVAKPTLGQKSQDVHFIETPDQLAHTDLSDKLLEKYIDGTEYRYLVLQGEVVAARRKERKNPRDLVNVQRVSLETKEWDERLVNMALQVAEVLGLHFAAVDFLVDSEGKSFVLEVNSAPGISWVHQPDEGPSVNVAKLLLDQIIATQKTP
jgi:glutathione synthase/RimK-type ligase-like ATP-grasp enzyme